MARRAADPRARSTFALNPARRLDSPRSDRLDALYQDANALARLMRYEEALEAFQKILAGRAEHLGALNGLGGVLTRIGRAERAIDCYDRALAMAPRTVELHINKGTALVALNRFEEALKCFASPTAIDPERAEAHYSAGLVRLRLGDFAAGWRGYEWRWRKADWADKRRGSSAPLWLGQRPIAGKTILLHSEQGLGDTIQFVRYAPLVAALGARVILCVQRPLLDLAASVPGVSSVVADGEASQEFDMHCPLASLPSRFETDIKTIPANVPYLRPDEQRLSKWRGRLPHSDRLRVGICWAGGSAHLNDHNRSIPLARFASLLSVSGLEFVSLQKEVSAVQTETLHQYGVLQLGREFMDFADTAAVVATLDLIVAVDTSVAHLAGAMGKAAATLLPFCPDFRWLLERTDSPWYPTMRLFRQTALGDWDGPLRRLRQELAEVGLRRVGAR